MVLKQEDHTGLLLPRQNHQHTIPIPALQRRFPKSLLKQCLSFLPENIIHSTSRVQKAWTWPQRNLGLNKGLPLAPWPLCSQASEPVFPPTTLKFDQGLCRVWGGLKVTCTRCQAWYWASARNLLKCSKAMLALAQAVGRTPGVNTHVCLCAQDALLSFPEISVYCLFYAVMINILLSGPTWVDACWKTKSSPGVPNASVSLASMTGQPQEFNNYRPSITTFSHVKKDQNNTQDTLN